MRLTGVAEADGEYSRYERVLISRVTWMEVLIGAEGDDVELTRFSGNTLFEIIPLDSGSCRDSRTITARSSPAPARRHYLGNRACKLTPYWLRAT